MNEDIKQLLGDLAPKTPEQEKIFSEAIDRIVQKAQLEKRRRLTQGVYRDGFNGLFMSNKKLQDKTDGFSKDREFRMVALIPQEMAEIAKKMYGDDVLTNKKKFREAFVKNEEGQFCLTVDPKSI